MLRKQGKKGFTLVELIVVIVILGILLAIAVPALIGYIDRAQNQGAIVEGATARTAMQTIVSDSYGRGGDFTPVNGTPFTVPLSDADVPMTEFNEAIDQLTGTNGFNVTELTVTNGVVEKFKVEVPGTGKTVEWTGNDYVVTG